MSYTNQQVIRLVTEEAWGKGRVDLVDELYAENYVNLNPMSGIPANREGVKMQIAAFYQAFPDMHVTVEDTLADGDKVTVRYTVRATHTGELMGIPATGKSVEVAGISIARLADGKVVEEFPLEDTMSMFQQIGLAPEMG